MDPAGDIQPEQAGGLGRLKLAAIALTVAGAGLFGYFIYSVGFYQISYGIERFGWDGFGVIVLVYFAKIGARAYAWKLSVHQPYSLRLKDTIPAVIIGEAMSSTIPLGILISGTSKAIAVRKKIPLVAGLSSVATENLFYSFTTGVFLIVGAFVFLRSFDLGESMAVTLDGLIGTLAFLIFLGLLMVVRQWHFASETCEWVYNKGYFQKWLEHIRLEVRLFENLIYGFYRHYPRLFVPICTLEAVYHLLGIVEVWFILVRLADRHSDFLTAFLLESISRLITIVFKLVPFMIGVDEAGAQFVGKTVGLAAGVGVTIAIIRKGRILFWTAIGWLFIIKRGFSIKDISNRHHQTDTPDAESSTVVS